MGAAMVVDLLLVAVPEAGRASVGEEGQERCREVSRHHLALIWKEKGVEWGIQEFKSC